MLEGAASFADLLKRYRAAAGLTQEGLAERASLSAAAISGLERGTRHRPYPYTVQRLVHALDLDEREAARLQRAARRPGGDSNGPRGEAVARAHSLPVQPTPFIGRRREVEEVGALLGQDEVRLLTLTGPGGVGKTRLALRVAEEVAELFPHGTALVSLASVDDPGLVPSSIGSVLDIKEKGGQPVLQSLIEHLREKRLLLVADNFEHLLPAADVLSSLLASCSHVTLLVTSRSVLHLAAEHEYPVQPLAAPTAEHHPDLDTLARYDAVQLFLQRAQAVRPEFSLTDENGSVIAEICSRLDGLPLAIELAAARIRLFPPRDLLAHLADRWRLLTGGPRDVPARQQTLRGTIDWSYSLLTPEERMLLARLSVFAGGCTFEAAEDVCNAAGDLDLLETMGALIDKSLLRQDDSSRDPVGQAGSRFSMLESIREYAAERLEETGQSDATREAHAAYCLRLAEDVGPALWGPEQARLLRRLDSERDNIRAALSWNMSRGHAEAALRIATSTFRAWESRGLVAEGRRWLAEALAAGGGADARLEGIALEGLGAFAWRQGDLDEARRLLERALVRARELGDDEATAGRSSTLGNVLADLGDYETARRLQEESLALRRVMGNRQFIGHSLGLLGYLFLREGKLDEARAPLEESLTMALEAGDTWSVGISLGALGSLALRAGDDATAQRFFGRALRVFRDLGEKPSAIEALWGLAAVAGSRGRPARALRLAGAVDALHPVIGWWVPSDDFLATARLKLDPAAGQHEWEAGRAMSLEEAVSYALEGGRETLTVP